MKLNNLLIASFVTATTAFGVFSASDKTQSLNAYENQTALPVVRYFKNFASEPVFTSDLTKQIKPYNYHTVSFYVDVNTMLTYFNEAIFGKYMYVSLTGLISLNVFYPPTLTIYQPGIDEYIITDYTLSKSLYEATTLTGLDAIGYTKRANENFMSVEFLDANAFDFYEPGDDLILTFTLPTSLSAPLTKENKRRISNGYVTNDITKQFDIISTTDTGLYEEGYQQALLDFPPENNATYNIFTMLRTGFTSLAGILNISLFPGLTLGTLLFLPLVFGIAYSLIKLLMGNK